MMWLICLGPTMNWSSASARCATQSDELRDDEARLQDWWYEARYGWRRRWPCAVSASYLVHCPSKILRRGTRCVSNSPLGGRLVASNCAFARIPLPISRLWRRSSSRRVCHPSFFLNGKESLTAGVAGREERRSMNSTAGEPL